MRHQRQLALANALFSDVQEARRQANDASQSRLARAYARHLCRTRPGCRSVTLHVQQHLIPEPAQVREAVAGPRRRLRPLWRADVHSSRMDRRLPVRRLLNETRRYLAGLVEAVRRGWDAFFFTPADPTALASIRIGIGLLAMWSLLVFGLDLQDFFGSEGWAEPSAIRASQREATWSFWLLVPDSGLRLVWVGCLVVLAMDIVGLFDHGRPP